MLPWTPPTPLAVLDRSSVQRYICNPYWLSQDSRKLHMGRGAHPAFICVCILNVDLQLCPNLVITDQDSLRYPRGRWCI